MKFVLKKGITWTKEKLLNALKAFKNKQSQGHCRQEILGSLRSYDGNCKENVSLKLKFALSLLRLFHVDHVVQNKRSALSLAWHEWFSCKGKEEKIYCSELPLSTEPQIWISRRRLADYVKTLHQKAYRTCSTIIFLHSTNQIIDLWRCRCRRQILSSLICKSVTFLLPSSSWLRKLPISDLQISVRGRLRVRVFRTEHTL